MNKLVLASGNRGKLIEIQQVLAECKLDVIAQSEFAMSEAEETGLTFVENAVIKARHACEHTGLPALADDSGLVVEDLQGQPGIYSSRYAGEDASGQDNINKLLSELAKVEQASRKAYFYCTLVLLRHAKDPCPIICHGSWQGEILQAQQGKKGFGYDPVFYLADLQCSAAELALTEKNQISHRGKALKQLLGALASGL